MMVEDKVGSERCRVVRGFRKLRRATGWAKARDVEALGRSIINAILVEEAKGERPIGNPSDMLVVSRRLVDKHMRLMHQRRAGQEPNDMAFGSD